jgi:flagellar biosynthesis protein FliP
LLGFPLLPPALIALPFKLLLFVAAGGWGLLVRGLVGSYA